MNGAGGWWRIVYLTFYTVTNRSLQTFNIISQLSKSFICSFICISSQTVLLHLPPSIYLTHSSSLCPPPKDWCKKIYALEFLILWRIVWGFLFNINENIIQTFMQINHLLFSFLKRKKANFEVYPFRVNSNTFCTIFLRKKQCLMI